MVAMKENKIRKKT